MNADAIPFLSIFEKKHRLEVPLFQRKYVWDKERHWEPLWEDISRKFIEVIDADPEQQDAPPHFLGAMVLDQKQTPTTHVDKRQVIDGQQRLTTFQIFLSAFRDFCEEHGYQELSDECKKFTLNDGMMADREVEQFKVWPTQSDRQQFADVVLTSSPEELKKKYPLQYKKYSRYPEPRPRMIEAYFYFYERLAEFLLGSKEEAAHAANKPLNSRLDLCFQVLRSALKVVVIDLDGHDDAQVIFETLNATGEPLLPADLLRNFIFQRAARLKESPEELYDKYWKKFDEDFWREEIRQGRLKRARSDLFMQHFLSSHQMRDIPIKHLFVEYKYWIEKKKPFVTVRQELETLARQRDDFRRLVEPLKEDALFPLPSFLITFDMSTAYPLLLFLLESNLSADELRSAASTLESYLLRRAVCGLTNQSYNKTFLALARALQYVKENLLRFAQLTNYVR